MSSVDEEEVQEPDLVYFETPSKLLCVESESAPMSAYTIQNSPQHSSQPFPSYPMLQSHSLLHQPQPPSICYPLPSVSNSYVEGDHLNLNPMAENFQNLATADSLIQEEVSRAAKTLFSKRNRTLLHWLNPGVCKGELKKDVNAAWDILPEPEKLFYISQVLGKLFVPLTTSLMVNPQLEQNGHSVSTSSIYQKTDTLEKKSIKINNKKQLNLKQKRKVILLSDDDISSDSALVVDTDAPRTKRKYTRRKLKQKAAKVNEERETISTTSTLDETVTDEEKPIDQLIKRESQDQPDNSIQIPKQDKIQIKTKKLKNEPIGLDVPRVKRKYVKRKLVRKKYTRRKPIGLESSDQKDPKLDNNSEQNFVDLSQQTNSSNDDNDIWLDLESEPGIAGFSLLNEEVDSFWDNIEDPNSLFMELEMK